MSLLHTIAAWSAWPAAALAVLGAWLLLATVVGVVVGKAAALAGRSGMGIVDGPGDDEAAYTAQWERYGGGSR